MWQWQAEVAALWMVENWWVMILWQIKGWKQRMSYPVELHGVRRHPGFPSKPHSAEVAVLGSWCRREVQRGRGHGLVPQNVCCELVCRGVWLKKSHLQSQKFLHWIGLMKTRRGPRASCALVGAACQHPPCQCRKAQLWWRGEYVSGATYTSSLQAARLVMAEMQDFSNAVQGSWAFQENCQCRPVLFSLNEIWCGGKINQQVRPLLSNWKMNICLLISQLKLHVHIPQFFFHYFYNLIVGFTFTLWKKIKPNQNQNTTSTFQFCYLKENLLAGYVHLLN